ncbi:hypothetical protein QMK33_13465 [Hymenobacter sp. H14-R3]|uniref:DUF5700 domain-containing putative Zn-dependent protease n=1 Tax=Hymenobacter sp. H14-R3 TaxID=3046308 RepID=UPI0024BA145D|nr:DUF5700 domain-containing putative Zn-dependent protease [Hymenobacter sp. H14-R3]MDJ0366161.1 hypothetical protein [Hymenobacter sp. H14-R3]
MLRFSQRPLLLAGLLLTAAGAQAQTIDTDGAAAYWQLTDALRRDEPLTDQAWQALLAVPANKVYASSVWGSDTASLRRYRRAIEVVYRPRYQAILQTKLTAKSWYYVLVNDYKEQEVVYKTFLAETVKNPAYLEKMYTYAYEFLPARNHTRVAGLKLGYVALGNDATSQAEGIFFSLRSARDNSQWPGILEAHEMHHQLRTAINTGTEDPADEGLLWSFYSAQNEGLADLIDKRVLLEQSADSAEIRSWLLKPAPAVIHKIDSTIQVQAAGGAATPLKFYRRLTNGSNGHLPGFYMAYAIVKSGYQKPLLANADNPFSFVLLYQQAAKKNWTYPRFSAVSERYIKQLARKYAKPRPATAATSAGSGASK